VSPEIASGERLEIPAGAIDPRGRLRVADAIDLVAGAAGVGATLIVTDRDLAMRQLGSLFGFADCERQVTIVSTFRLGEGEIAAARARNEIAHERGHLAGLKHCRDRRCVMHPAAKPEDIDGRGETPCERCASGERRVTGRFAAAIAFLAVSVAGFSYGPALVAPKFQMPFT
jgi:archaemetzincin